VLRERSQAYGIDMDRETGPLRPENRVVWDQTFEDSRG